MRPKINFLTLSVAHLDQAVSFYTEVFGFPVSERSDELCLFDLEDDFFLAVQRQEDFRLQTRSRENHSGGFILSHNATSADEVDQIVAKALSFGAEKTETMDEGWGYSVTFRDPEGHHWEILFARQS